MGIDFDGLLRIGQQIAARGGDTSKIDPGEEQNAFDVAVRKEAAKNGVDASEIYSNTSIADLMGVHINANKGTKGDELADALNAFVRPNTEASVGQTLMAFDLAIAAGLDIDEIEEETDELVAYHTLNAYGNGKAKQYENKGMQVGELVEAGYSEKMADAFMYTIMA